MQENNALPWQKEDWSNETENWIIKSLQKHNIELTSTPVNIHSAPWSMVYKVPTNKDIYYFKALCPALKHEPILTQQLAIWHPNRVQSVLEIDSERGWMLMPDGGGTLRQLIEVTPSLNYWKKIIPTFARFQQSMIPHLQELSSLGVRDRRLQLLPILYQRLIADQESMCIGKPDGLTHEECKKLKRVVPIVQQLCKNLTTIGIPETLQHDDFHDGNIFATYNDFKFFDWAESFISHPFFSMVVTLRSIAYRFKLDENSHELRKLEDLYLSEWQAYAPLNRLREGFELAMVLGRVNRALTWHMVVSSLPEPYRSNEADAVPGWLQLFLEKIKPYA